MKDIPKIIYKSGASYFLPCHKSVFLFCGKPDLDGLGFAVADMSDGHHIPRVF